MNQPTIDPYPLALVPDNGCLYAVAGGMNGEPHLFCGMPRGQGCGVYCAHHKAITIGARPSPIALENERPLGIDIGDY